MKLLVDKNRLIELISDLDAGLKAHKLLAYSFADDPAVFKIVLESLLKELKENDFASYEVLVFTNLLRNYTPTIQNIPLLLEILREAKQNLDEPALHNAGTFAVLSLLLKIDFNELKRNKNLFGDDELNSNIWQYIEWIEENRSRNFDELKEELISITREFTEQTENDEEGFVNDVELLQEQITDFRSLLIAKKDVFYPLIEDSLNELTDTENYTLQDFSIEMAGIWKADNVITPLVEIARLSDPELSVYQKSIDSLSFIQSEKIFSFAEDMFRFQEEARVSFAEILGHYPYDKSEEILLKNLYKEKDRDVVTLCAWALSNIFSIKGAAAIKEVADKGKINSEMITLNEILHPIYIYHKLPIPDWMKLDNHDHHS